MLTYPLALSGDRVGVVHKLEPYNDLYLLKEYQKNVVNARYCLVFSKKKEKKDGNIKKE